jgi:hypothetical protein
MNHGACVDAVQERACVDLPDRNESIETAGSKKGATEIKSHRSYGILVEGAFVSFLILEH